MNSKILILRNGGRVMASLVLLQTKGLESRAVTKRGDLIAAADSRWVGIGTLAAHQKTFDILPADAVQAAITLGNVLGLDWFLTGRAFVFWLFRVSYEKLFTAEAQSA
jgi:hypothetical protein